MFHTIARCTFHTRAREPDMEAGSFALTAVDSDDLYRPSLEQSDLSSIPVQPSGLGTGISNTFYWLNWVDQHAHGRHSTVKRRSVVSVTENRECYSNKYRYDDDESDHSQAD